MKPSILLIVILSVVSVLSSCELFEEKDDNTKLGGDPSPMGAVGTTYSSSSVAVAGVSELQGEVTALNDRVSTFSGSAIVSNEQLKNVLSNIPEITLNGDTATTSSVKIKQTKDGIQLLSGPTPGILVKYDASVGDEYPIEGNNYVRRVISKSTEDDYYYGFFLIKVIEVEEVATSLKSSGISRVIYWANHRFGLVGITLHFDDATSAHFPVYCSTEN